MLPYCFSLNRDKELLRAEKEQSERERAAQEQAEKERAEEERLERERQESERAAKEQAEKERAKEDEEAKAREKNAAEMRTEAMAEERKDSAVTAVLAQLEDTLEQQLVCATCLELPVHPVALNCSHSYCWLCLGKLLPVPV
jgi:hypothetical protein